MFTKLQEDFTNRQKEFSTQIEKQIKAIPDNFFNKEERDFLVKLKDGTKIFFDQIDQTEPNKMIRYKLKIDALKKLNSTLKKYPTLKTQQKLDAFAVLRVISVDLKKFKTDILKDVIKTKAQKIKAITFGGTFEIPKDYDDMSKQFDDAIKDINSALRSATGEEKTTLENALIVVTEYQTNLYHMINGDKKYNVKNVSGRIDSLVDRVRGHNSNGPITLTLFPGVERTFNNQLEALNALEETKTQLSEEFYGIGDAAFSMSGGLLYPYQLVLNLTKTLTWGEEGSFWDARGLIAEGFMDTFSLGDDREFNGVSNIGGLIEMAAGVGLGAIGISAAASFLGLHRGIPESIIRRGTDIVSRFSADLQYEDYGKTGKTPMVDSLDSDTGKEYLEYKQREGLVEMFRQKRDSLDPHSDAYKKLEGDIKILNSFKLNKTSTFYYIAHKISKGHDLGVLANLKPATFFYNAKAVLWEGGKLYGYNPLKDFLNKDKKWFKTGFENQPKFIPKIVSGFIPTKLGGFHNTVVNSTQTFYDETIDWLNGGNKTPLQSGVDLFHKGKTVVFESAKEGETPKLQVKGESTEKTKKYNYIIDYIKSKNIEPKKKAALIEKFEKYVETLGKAPDSISQVTSNLVIMLNDDLGDQNKFLSDVAVAIEEVERKVKKEKTAKIPYVKNTSENFQKLKALENLRELLYKKEWIGSSDEFKTVFEDVKLNDTLVTENASIKLAGINFQDTFDRIIQEGKDLYNNTDSVKKSLFDMTSETLEESTKSQFVKNAEDYISYRIEENKVEESSKKRLKAFLNGILVGDIKIKSEHKLHQEIGRIINGGLAEHELINVIHRGTKSGISPVEKANIKILIDEIIANPDLLVKEADIKALLGSIQNGTFTSLTSRPLATLDTAITLQGIDESENLRERDFAKKLQAIGKNVDSFFEEVTKTISINENIPDKDAAILEINKLKASVKNGYTDLQIIHIIGEIKNGETFKDVSKIQEAPSTESLDNLLAPENKRVLLNAINKIDTEKSSISSLKDLDELNTKIGEIKSNSYYIKLETADKNKLDNAFSDSEVNVINEYKRLGLDAQIDIIRDNQKGLNDFKIEKVKMFILETIVQIDALTETSDKIEYADKLKNAITNDKFDTTRITDSLNKLDELKGIHKLNQEFNDIRDGYSTTSDKKGLERIRDDLIELRKNRLVDDDLRSKISTFMSTINGALDNISGNPSSPRTATNNTVAKEPKTDPKVAGRTFEQMSDTMISNRINKYNDTYDRAIKQAQINLDYDTVTILRNEQITNQSNERLIVQQVGTLESKLAGRVGIKGKAKLGKYEDLQTQYEHQKGVINKELVEKGILKEVNGRYEYQDGKSSTDLIIDSAKYPGLLDSLKKAI